MNIKKELRAVLLKEGKHKTHKNEYGCLMVYLDVAKKDWDKLQDMIDDEDLYIDKEDPSYGRETEPHATILFGFHADVPDEGIEKEIDKMEELLPPLRNFILPGGNTLVSYCHIARCVCRRAERAISRLNQTEESPEIVNKFLNRLSDFLFVLSRKIALNLDIEEIKWHV